jgi:hypothetical protein
MTTKQVVGILIVACFTFGATGVQAAGPWSTWQSTERPGVSMRERHDSACGSKGKYYWYQFKNSGLGRAELLVVFTYTDADGKPGKDESSEEMDPGREGHQGWLCAIPGTVRRSIQDAPGSNARRSRAPTPSNSAEISGSNQPLFGSSLSRPTIRNVQLDDECVKLLRRQSARLEGAGAAKQLLAWSPLIMLAGETSAPHAAFTILTTNWEELAVVCGQDAMRPGDQSCARRLAAGGIESARSDAAVQELMR